MSIHKFQAGDHIVTHHEGGNIKQLATIVSIGAGGATILETFAQKGTTDFRLMQSERSVLSTTLKDAEKCDEVAFRSYKAQLLADLMFACFDSSIISASRNNSADVHELREMIYTRMELLSTHL